ncbi:hypothetical protein ACJQWK_02916 [Exserohilum turcicum]
MLVYCTRGGGYQGWKAAVVALALALARPPKKLRRRRTGTSLQLIMRMDIIGLLSVSLLSLSFSLLVLVCRFPRPSSPLEPLIDTTYPFSSDHDTAVRPSNPYDAAIVHFYLRKMRNEVLLALTLGNENDVVSVCPPVQG